MGFFENLAGLLKGAVGNNRDNDPEDVLTVKRGLSDAGYYDLARPPEPHAYITKEMDDGIKRFQQDNGLRVDGYLLPGGETEDALRRRPSGPLQTREKRDTDPKGQIRNAFQWGERNPDKFLTLMSAKNEGAQGNKASSDSKPVEYDATGRMIPPGETQRRERIAQRGKDTLAGTAGNNPLAQESDKANIPVPGRKPLDSPYRPPILKGVDNETVKKEVIKQEDTKLFLYKDTADGGGRVTVGSGFMLPDAEEAKNLPFEIKDKTGKYREATPEEIERAFRKVEAIQNNNYLASAFEPGTGKKAKEYVLDDLRLPKEAEARLLEEKLREHAEIVVNKLKNDQIDPDSLPPSVKKLVLDLQYNNGLKYRERQDLFNAIRNRDWTKAKEEVMKFKINQKRDEWRLQQINEAMKWDQKQK